MGTWHAYRKSTAELRTLWAAAKADDVDEIERLLHDGAPIDERDQRGYTPLMFATYAGHQRAFDLLIRRGADPNSRDRAGNTVLMGAAFKGHGGMVSTLLALGADPRARNRGGLDAHGFATIFGRAEVATLLAAYAPLGKRARA